MLLGVLVFRVLEEMWMHGYVALQDQTEDLDRSLALDSMVVGVSGHSDSVNNLIPKCEALFDF